MTPIDQQLDDQALDALLEKLARHDAPQSLTSRVTAALDGTATGVLTRHRVGFVLATVAAALVVVASWTMWRHQTSPVPARAAQDAPPRASGPVASARSAGVSQPPERAVPVAVPLRAAPATRRRAPWKDDHDRALPPLASLPGVGPRDIEPAALQTVPLEIERIDDIAPLTIQSGRDTSGRGDFR